MSLEEFPLALSRHAFSPRDAARAGDIWRLFQDAAVTGSARRGWGPERYRDEGCAFIVRDMTVVHHGEAAFGPPIDARTWVSTFQRGMFSTRQIRLSVRGNPLASASQRWVFVAMPALRPARAPDSLVEAFEVHDLDPDVGLPAHDAIEGPEHAFAFEAWHTWMDPLDHANHPAYVDWIDEALSRVLIGAGLAPSQLVPRAEQITYRSGVVAAETVRVTSRLVGLTASGEAVTQHTVHGHDGRTCAEATVVRTLATHPERLITALRAG